MSQTTIESKNVAYKLWSVRYQLSKWFITTIDKLVQVP